MKRETSPPPNCWAAMLWFTTRSAQHSVNGSFLPPSCKAKFDAWTQKFLSCSSSVNADAVVRNYGNSRLGRATVSSPERIQVFAYINADNAPLYRTIMRVFTESKQRFLFQLRPQDVLEAVRISVGQEASGRPEIDSGLEQLCEWGVLHIHPDPTSVGTC